MTDKTVPWPFGKDADEINIEFCPWVGDNQILPHPRQAGAWICKDEETFFKLAKEAGVELKLVKEDPERIN